MAVRRYVSCAVRPRPDTVGVAPSSLNRKQFARLLLGRIGIAPSDGAVQALVGWEQAEGGHWHNTARYNPLNTTLNMPGSGDTGSQGNISSYRDWQQGLRATKKTLELPAYTGILSALRRGDPGATARAIGASPWAPDAGYSALVARTIAAAPKHAGRPGGSPAAGSGRALMQSQGAQAAPQAAQPAPQAVDTASQSTLLPLLQSLQAQPQQRPSMGLAAPAASAAPKLAQGAASLVTGAPAARAGVDAGSLIAAAQSAQRAVADPNLDGASKAAKVGTFQVERGGTTLQKAVARAAAIDSKHYAYEWGGGHNPGGTPTHGVGHGSGAGVGFDCSGAVSKVLGIDARVSGQFTQWGKAGAGGNVTVYANATHVLMKLKVNGRWRFFGTSSQNHDGGAGWIPTSYFPAGYLSNFTVRHATI